MTTRRQSELIVVPVISVPLSRDKSEKVAYLLGDFFFNLPTICASDDLTFNYFHNLAVFEGSINNTSAI